MEISLLIPDPVKERAERYRKAATSPSQLVRSTLDLAEHHQQRLRMHTIPQIECTHCNTAALSDFFAMVKAQIASDKFESFKSLMRYPLPSNAVLAKVWDKLSRVFEAKNKKIECVFSDDAICREFTEYKKKARLKGFVRDKLFQFAKTEVNGIVVIDADEDGKPYPYLVKSDCIIDFSAGADGVFDYVTYRNNGKIVTIDSEDYFVFEDKGGQAGELLSVSSHYLGYVPARWVWNESISASNPNLKLSPITPALELLDWYVFYVTASKSLMISGAYPIYSGYEANCNYNDNGEYCDHGMLKNEQGEYIIDANSPSRFKPCPVCGTKRIAGPGSYVEVPVPDSNTPDMRNPVQMLAVDKNALDFSVTKKAALEKEIITMCVGSDTEILSDSSINEKQVEATFESQTAILLRLKNTFEDVISFIESTMAALMYGDDFKMLHVDLGNEYFLESITAMRDEYSKAKEAGASLSELSLIQKRIADKEFRNSDKDKERYKIMQDLEPLKGLTIAECLTMFDKGLVSKNEILLKINFEELISKFEHNNGNICIFASAIQYKDKIVRIKSEINKYLSDYGTENRTESAN